MPWRLLIWLGTGEGGGGYSHYFLVTKRTGGCHPILNLCGLNSFFRVAKFRMETLTSILQGLHKVGGWCRWISRTPSCMCRYTSVTRGTFGLLSGAGELIVYQWKVLPFGLATDPRVFTKLLAPLAAHLHLQGCLM